MEPPWARAPGIDSHGGGRNERKSAGEKGSFEFATSPYRQKARLATVLLRCTADGSGAAASVLQSFQKLR